MEEPSRIFQKHEKLKQYLLELGNAKVYSQLKQYSFTYIALDLLRYRTGSMNETLEPQPNPKGEGSPLDNLS